MFANGHLKSSTATASPTHLLLCFEHQHITTSREWKGGQRPVSLPPVPPGDRGKTDGQGHRTRLAGACWAHPAAYPQFPTAFNLLPDYEMHGDQVGNHLCPQARPSSAGSSEKSKAALALPQGPMEGCCRRWPQGHYTYSCQRQTTGSH